MKPAADYLEHYIQCVLIVWDELLFQHRNNEHYGELFINVCIVFSVFYPVQYQKF